jgi:hypothetical protein
MTTQRRHDRRPPGPKQAGSVAWMAAILAGRNGSAGDATPGAARLQRAARHLRAAADPELLQVADAFERFLDAGGDLQALLGLRARRGRAGDQPHVARRTRARDQALRDLAATVAPPDASVTEKARALADLLRSPVQVAIVREASGVQRVPTSSRQLVRILRG